MVSRRETVDGTCCASAGRVVCVMAAACWAHVEVWISETWLITRQLWLGDNRNDFLPEQPQRDFGKKSFGSLSSRLMGVFCDHLHFKYFERRKIPLGFGRTSCFSAGGILNNLAAWTWIRLRWAERRDAEWDHGQCCSLT